MQKCEHNEKITRFCASESCAWKQAAGCVNCIKKYHNHMGQVQIVDEKEIQPLLRKYKTDAYTKPKAKVFEEAIHDYFGNLKTQFINFIEDIDKRVRTELCYPYLTKNNIVGVYKKLKKKEYKKLSQKEFKVFYDFTSKLTFEEINSQQKKLYLEAVQKNSLVINTIFQTINNLQIQFKNLQSANLFKIDKVNQQKIKNTFQLLGQQFNKPQEPSVKEQIRSEVRPKQQRQSLLPLLKAKSTKQQQQRKIFSKQPEKIVQQSKKQQELNQIKKKLLDMMQQSTPKKQPPKQRDVSIQVGKQWIVQEHAFSNKAYQNRTSILKKNEESDVPNRFEQYTKKFKQDQQRKIMVEDSGNKGMQDSTNSLNLNDNFGKMNRFSNQITEITPKHNKLPSDEHQKMTPSPDSDRKKRLRAVVVPIKNEFPIEPHQSSPLLKRKQVQKNKQSEIIHLQQVKNEQKKINTVPLTDKQKDSISLLAESLKRKSDQAIPLLYKALEFGKNNLSAAEYLSFLLLQCQKPMECLKICNSILQQLEGEVIYDVNLLHIHNNKAVSLITLGRYSEAIPLLQKCLQVKQSDRFYKNLGDAYFSIGIYQKASYNYERSITLNSKCAETYYNLAVCLYCQENYNNAMVMIDKATKMESNNPEYLELLTHIRERL